SVNRGALQLFYHWGRHQPWAHAGNPKARAVLASKARRETDEAMLAGLVCGYLAPSHESENAADVKDVSLFCFEERWQQLTNQLYRGQQIDRHQSIPLLSGHAEGLAVIDEPCIVHEDV